MFDTGVNRPVDPCGRVVLPNELRKSHNMDSGASVVFYLEGDTIILKSCQPGCVFCGDIGQATMFHGHTVCVNCKSELVAFARKRYVADS